MIHASAFLVLLFSKRPESPLGLFLFVGGGPDPPARRDVLARLAAVDHPRSLVAIVAAAPFALHHLHVDGDAGWEVDVGQGLDDLGGRVEDVDHALVDAHLELLAGVLVDEG